MIEITDKNLLEAYLNKYNIRSIFSSGDIPFKLYRYDVGEMMIISHPQDKYIKFLVEGTIVVDKLDEDGQLHRLSTLSAPKCLGEVEVAGYSFTAHYHEVIKTAYCIELPLDTMRDTLMNDIKFLQYLVKQMAYTIYTKTYTIEEIKGDVETRLLSHIKTKCPNGRFSGMEDTAKQLRCSRRQLQRVVNELIEKGLLKKTGWGEYSLTEL